MKSRLLKRCVYVLVIGFFIFSINGCTEKKDYLHYKEDPSVETIKTFKEYGLKKIEIDFGPGLITYFIEDIAITHNYNKFDDVDYDLRRYFSDMIIKLDENDKLIFMSYSIHKSNYKNNVYSKEEFIKNIETMINTNGRELTKKVKLEKKKEASWK